MPSENDEGGAPSRDPIQASKELQEEEIPSELRADFQAFRKRLAPAIDRGAVDASGIDLLIRYAILLDQAIPKLALIGKGDRTTLFTRHILDSLGALIHFDAPPAYFLDIGSGGGLPGIPLGIAWPTSKGVLVEVRERKAAFLERAVRALGLRNVRVACMGLDEHARGQAPIYDAVFVRAVADLPGLLDLVAPACAPGARWVYFLGRGIDRAELAASLGRTGRAGDEVEGEFGGRLMIGSV